MARPGFLQLYFIGHQASVRHESVPLAHVSNTLAVPLSEFSPTANPSPWTCQTPSAALSKRKRINDLRNSLDISPAFGS